MMAYINYKRDEHSGNRYTSLELPNDESYRFPGTGMFGPEAMLKQLGYKKMWRSWKAVYHGYNESFGLRIRISKDAGK